MKPIVLYLFLFFSVTSFANTPKIFDKLHWVGVLNIKYNHDFSRAYSTQVISLKPANRSNGLKWYVEVGVQTFADESTKTGGIDRQSLDVASNSLEDFFENGIVNFKVGEYYFVGKAQNIASPIRGKIYETKSNELAGYFEAFPRHDSSDSYGFAVPMEDGICFSQAHPPLKCYGPGAP